MNGVPRTSFEYRVKASGWPDAVARALRRHTYDHNDEVLRIAIQRLQRYGLEWVVTVETSGKSSREYEQTQTKVCQEG